MTDVLNSAVSNAWDAESGSEGRHAEHGGRLWPTNGHNFLGNASASTTHSDAQTINAGSNQRGRLFLCHNIATNHVQAGMLLLDVLDHIDLEHAVALAAIEDNDIKPCFNKKSQSLLVFLTCSNCGGADELLGMRKLRCKREVKVLHQV